MSEIEELKAENDRLKKELYIALREENRWKSNCSNYRDVYRKQYHTLQEIKEIAEETVKTTGMISAGFIMQVITKA